MNNCEEDDKIIKVKLGFDIKNPISGRIYDIESFHNAMFNKITTENMMHDELFVRFGRDSERIVGCIVGIKREGDAYSFDVKLLEVPQRQVILELANQWNCLSGEICLLPAMTGRIVDGKTIVKSIQGFYLSIEKSMEDE